MKDKARRTISHVVDDLFLQLDNVERRKNHDRFLKYVVGKKTLATYVINHHGDGLVALWLKVPREMQQTLVEMDSNIFFVPPYVGKQGWVGVLLSMKTNWEEVVAVVLEAYEGVVGKPHQDPDQVVVSPPRDELLPVEVDPFNTPEMQNLLARVREFVEKLPDTDEIPQFGSPAFKVGKKSFMYVGFMDRRPCIEVWVGKDAQLGLASDPRFGIPRYTGHNGWIMCRTQFEQSDKQAHELALGSFRHFALKRTLKKLDGE
ncbi:MAG: MmcQ/YjbR family DNA-binding protein [Gammaproteobacteria bacterium]|nr:MmcQ/YjbR family DNA-binding protein [Gammaproteobacteria bacterium]